MLDYAISRVKHDSYSTSSATVVVVFVDLANTTVSESIISGIGSTAVIGNEEIIVNGFYPSCKCV